MRNRRTSAIVQVVHFNMAELGRIPAYAKNKLWLDGVGYLRRAHDSTNNDPLDDLIEAADNLLMLGKIPAVAANEHWQTGMRSLGEALELEGGVLPKQLRDLCEKVPVA